MAEVLLKIKTAHFFLHGSHIITHLQLAFNRRISKQVDSVWFLSSSMAKPYREYSTPG